jgi:uncharacterized protein (TIGR02646 family)
MIYIDRNTEPAPTHLTMATSKAIKETNDATDFYRIHNNFINALPLPFDFTAYNSNKAVKKALIKLFNGKCAYCESRLVTVSRGEIEHFRPKLGIGSDKKALLKPAYYWLAANWNNLLLACTNCNQQNTFEIIGEGTKTVGKMNQFPLLNEKLRCRHPNHIIDKENLVRLVIDPCIDKPQKHIYFTNSGLIKPTKRKGTIVSIKGKTSIDVYALQRKELVEEREMLIIKVKAQIETVNRLLKIRDGCADPLLLPSIISLLNDEVIKLKLFLDKKQPYLAVTRQFIIPFLKKALGIKA